MKFKLKWPNEEEASDGDLFIAVAGMRAYSFTKKILYHRCFLMTFVKFTEHHF